MEPGTPGVGGCCWLHEPFLKDKGRLLLGSRDSNAVSVSITLMLAGTPQSPDPGFSEARAISHPLRVSCRPQQALVGASSSLGHKQKTACALQDTQAKCGRFLSFDHMQLSVEMETHQLDCGSSLGVMFKVK